MAGYKTDEDLEDRVRVFLKGIGLDQQVRPDLMTVITKIKQRDKAFQYARIPDADMPDALAQWDSDTCSLRMRENTFIGMQRGESRACMSVAHELMHYVLRHEGLLNRAPDVRTSELIGNKLRQQESEARRAGAILLAPEHLIPDGATADEIAAMFGLSLEAATYRHEEAVRIRRRRRGELRKLPSDIVEYLREAQRRGHPVVTKLDDD